MKFSARYACVVMLAGAVAAGLPSSARALTLHHQNEALREIDASARWDTADGFITLTFRSNTSSETHDGVLPGTTGYTDASSYADVSAKRYSTATNSWVEYYFGQVGPSDYSWDEIQGILNIHVTASGSNAGVPSSCSVRVVVSTDSPPLPDTDRGPLHALSGGLFGYQAGASYDNGSSAGGVSVGHERSYGSYGEHPGPAYPSSASGSLCGWSETAQGAHNATIQRTEYDRESYTVSP